MAGRFAAMALLDPDRGMAGVRELRARLAEPWVVGVYLHTHSFDRRLDHADLYPLYAAATDFDVPVAMQAGTSGGLMPSECGRPITIDRAASTFPRNAVRAVAPRLAMGGRGDRDGTEVPERVPGHRRYPPRHWPDAVHRFVRGPGRHKVVFGTNFPTVGHRHALAQLCELDLSPDVAAALRQGTARRVFTPDCPKEAPRDRRGLQHAAQPPVAEHTRYFDAAAVRIGVEYRYVDPASLTETYAGNAAHLAELEERSPDGGFSDEGVSIHVCGDDGHEYVRFDVFDEEPHYHYVHKTPADGEIINNVIAYDAVALGDMLDWAIERLRTRLPDMLRARGRRRRRGTPRQRAGRPRRHRRRGAGPPGACRPRCPRRGRG